MQDILARLNSIMREITHDPCISIGAELEVPYVCKVGEREIPVTIRVRWTENGFTVPNQEEQVNAIITRVLAALNAQP